MGPKKKWVFDNVTIGIVGYVGLGTGAEGDEGSSRRRNRIRVLKRGFRGLGN